MRLEDIVIVVTGAGGGLGEAMAGGFVAEGASVVCGDIAGDRLDEAVAGMTGPGEATAVEADVRESDDVDRLIDAGEALGGIDVLVNNAGVKQLTLTGEEHPVHEVPVELWDAVTDTNLRGTFLCSRAALPGMLDRSSGRLIHVSSGHGKWGRVRRAPYVASKFGVEGFHWTLSLELVETGVDSLAFTPPPGGVRTREAAFLDDPATQMRHDADVVVEPLVRLAAGEGRNGGRYRGLADGVGFEETDYVLD